MAGPLKARLGRRVPLIALAPVFVGLYFVLALATANGSESLRIGDVRFPMLVASGFAVLALLLSLGFTGSWDKASVLSTCVVVAFSSFGYLIHGAIEAWAVDSVRWAPRLLAGLTIALLAIALGVRLTSRSLNGLARYLTLVSVLLTTFAAVRFLIQTWSSDNVAPATRPPATPGSPISRRPPDIYVIVPDKYTGSSQLAEQYGLDNRPFEQFLRRRGFLIPARAQANYVQTFLALAAMLNLRYLDDLPGKVGSETKSRRPVDPLVENNELMSFLRSRGYQIVFFPTAFPTTRHNRMADIQIPSPARVRPEFATAWLWSTPLPVLHEGACQLLGCLVDRAMYIPESAELIEWKFEQLRNLAGGERPIFAFIHLMIPHEPYIYRRDCQRRAPYWPLTDSGEEEPMVKQAYAEQILCLNQKLERLVVALQERSLVPPAILIQSDHGHARLGRFLPDLADVPGERQDERASVFAAYSFPGAPVDELPDSVTPVNAVRFLLRAYFDAPLPPLDDRTYWSSYERPYQFTRLTGQASTLPINHPKGE